MDSGILLEIIVSEQFASIPTKASLNIIMHRKKNNNYKVIDAVSSGLTWKRTI